MDCVDQATNSTTYLRLFAGDGLLDWHTVGPILKRGHILWGIPHATAVIVESASGEAWAVDSWYLDNGLPALRRAPPRLEGGLEPAGGLAVNRSGVVVAASVARAA